MLIKMLIILAYSYVFIHFLFSEYNMKLLLSPENDLCNVVTWGVKRKDSNAIEL